MATPNGLVVPSIKGCHLLSISEIAEELGRLRLLAASNSLTQADLSGGTITISNIGAIGGTYAGPLINTPQLAIVAVGRIRVLPRFDADGKLYPAPIMNVSAAAPSHTEGYVMLW